MSKQPNKHSTMSFDQHVQAGVRAALGGAIDAKISAEMERLKFELAQQYVYYDMRLEALESFLISKAGVTKEEVESKFMDIEEAKMGLAKAEGAAQQGDAVRFTSKEIGSDKPATITVTDRLHAQPYRFNELVEAQMVGMNAGETKLITIQDAGKDVTHEVTVTRIARKIPAPNAENN